MNIENHNEQLKSCLYDLYKAYEEWNLSSSFGREGAKADQKLSFAFQSAHEVLKTFVEGDESV